MLVKPSSAPRNTDRQCRAGNKATSSQGALRLPMPAPQSGAVALEQPGSDAERRGKQRPEPHPLRRAHGLTLKEKAGHEKL